MNVLRSLHGEKGNLFFSGTSLRTALGMTALGARGKTLDEMAQTLGSDPDRAKNAAAAKAEVDAWKQAAGKAELVIANRLWVASNYSLEKSFLAETQSGYGASAVLTDFAKAPEPSRQRINGWVSDTTKGKIKDLLPHSAVGPLTRLVLTNAIYFKGNWEEPFKKSDTRDQPFHADAGDVNVPMMHRSGMMSYGESDEVRLVELSYKESDLSMLIALPRKAEQLATIEAQIRGANVDAWAKSLTPTKVDLAMPKFTFSWGRSVKPELEALGMRLAFTDKADFSAMSSPKAEPLLVSDVFHQAFVLVDETGTEAAAATGVVMVVTTSMQRAISLELDRPFLFFIRDRKNGEALFSGRVANPK